jgi:uncharacterized protein (TIGR03118 family)
MKVFHIIAQLFYMPSMLAMAFAAPAARAEVFLAAPSARAEERFAGSTTRAEERFAGSTTRAEERFAKSTTPAEERFAKSTIPAGGNGNLAAPTTSGGDFATSTTPVDGNFYQLNYISNGFIPSGFPPPAKTDPNLVNSWGIAFNPFGFAWVANNGTGVSTLYDGFGNAQSLVVQIPSPGNDIGGGSPTGIVYNGSPGFMVSKGATSGPSRFIFATEDGIIAGWAPDVDPTHAIRVIDNSTSTGAVYKGLALSAGGSGGLLYATDFRNRKIDVFDSSFNPVILPEGAFTDPAVPSIDAPFGIQAINGNIYVSYAKQDANRHDEEKGAGLGLINVFDPNGVLLRRIVAAESASRQMLNAPWGMVLAPAGFGKFSNRLLVGNFGDGKINAFDLATGEFAGQLEAANDLPIQIDGLWGLAFGNGFANQPVNTLFFTAGPGDEQQGVYGRLDVQ